MYITPAGSYLAATARPVKVSGMRSNSMAPVACCLNTHRHCIVRTPPPDSSVYCDAAQDKKHAQDLSWFSENAGRAGQHLIALLDARIHAHIPHVREGHGARGCPPAGNRARAGHEALGWALRVHTRLKGMPLQAEGHLLHDHHTVPALTNTSHTHFCQVV